MGNNEDARTDVDGSNFIGSHSKRHAGKPDSVEFTPQLGHPSPPGVVDVLDNNPIRANIKELCEPARPILLPATDKS